MTNGPDGETGSVAPNSTNEFSIEIIEQKRKQLKSDQQSDQQSDSSSDSSSDSDEHEPTLPDDDSIETLPQIQQPVHIVDTQNENPKPRFTRVKVINSIDRGRWTGKDSQIQPGDGIKHVGAVNEIRRIQISDDNLKNKDPKGINKPPAVRTSKVITAITLMAGLTRCSNPVTIGRRLSAPKVPVEEQNRQSPTLLSSKHQQMADAVNSVVRDVQAKQLVSTPAFESAIEKCMSQLKLTVMSAADQEYNTLRERIRLLEIDMAMIKRENELLKQQQTLDQRNEFEMLMRMTVEEVAMYHATQGNDKRTKQPILKSFEDNHLYNQHPTLFETLYATTTGKPFYENHAKAPVHQQGHYSRPVDGYRLPDGYPYSYQQHKAPPPTQTTAGQQQQQTSATQQQQQQAPQQPPQQTSNQTLADRSNAGVGLQQQQQQYPAFYHNGPPPPHQQQHHSALAAAQQFVQQQQQSPQPPQSYQPTSYQKSTR